MHRPVDRAVDYDMRGLYLAVDARVRRNHQRARLIGQRRNVAPYQSVHTQSTAENHVALDARRRADQAVDPVLRLACLVEHFFLLPPQLTTTPTASRAAGSIRSRRRAPARFPLSPSG